MSKVLTVLKMAIVPVVVIVLYRLAQTKTDIGAKILP